MPLTQAPVNVNTAGFTQIIAVTRCGAVTVQETGQASSTDFLVAFPNSNSGPKTCAAGREYTFSLAGPNNNLGAQFLPGQTVGWLKTLVGSVNFDVVEQ
jgi:hypothetical protein